MQTGITPSRPRRVSFRATELFSRRLACSARARLRAALLRLCMPIIDLLLHGFCLLLPADNGPGIPVSNLAEVARALNASGPLLAAPERKPPLPAHGLAHSARAASRCAVFLIAVCLIPQLSLHAQTPAFADLPDEALRYIPAINIDMP